MLRALGLGITLLFCAASSVSLAQSETKPQSETSTAPQISPSIQSFMEAYGGDPGSIRSFLDTKGLTYSLTYTNEGFGNVSGGIKRGGIYDGQLNFQLDADLDKLLDWKGAAFHTNAYQVHGRGLSRYYIGNLLAVSNIEALASTRLYELWFEQKFLEDKVALRLGQLGADTEFLISQYAALFVNTTFGWPAITAADLPSSGPSYPLATPGIRLKVTLTDQFTLLAAVFNGNPAGPPGPFGPFDPQRRDRTGTNFRVNDPAFVIAEMAYAYNQAKDSTGLPGTVKFGGWYHLGRFDDQRFGTDNLSLASPDSNGIPRRVRGDSGLYAILDQMVYRISNTTDQGIGIFARLAVSPSDQNLISFYADTGVSFKGMIPSRPDDLFAVGFAYAQISSRVTGLDLDAISFTGMVRPVQSSEAVIEVTYQAQVLPGWTLQPDFQYIFRPGGNVQNPRAPNGVAIKDAMVFGLRSIIRY
ncbi:carbohydrate porin [Microvirga sp. 2MCAF38]|uniref:carbohydrate porin n=1 Tax=Microvirga sp. 2MCAF38 TaxID=3232989 RepID=UPI003F998DEF